MGETRFEGLGNTRPYEATAWYYAEYRSVLSMEFAVMLARHLGWTRADRILDLGSGPGQASLRLAPFVGEVVAVDPAPDMLAEGERRAEAIGVENVRFVAGSSDDLTALGAPAGQLKAVTIGSAFHWMRDQDRVLRDLDGFVAGSGALVILAYDIGPPAISVEGRDGRPWRERQPWARVNEIVARHLADVAERPHPRGRHDPFPDIFARSSFSKLSFLRFEYEREEQPSVEAALGHLYSTSHVLARLGPRRADLEAEVRRALVEADTSPVSTRVVDSALIARKPS